MMENGRKGQKIYTFYYQKYILILIFAKLPIGIVNLNFRNGQNHPVFKEKSNFDIVYLYLYYKISCFIFLNGFNWDKNHLLDPTEYYILLLKSSAQWLPVARKMQKFRRSAANSF